MPDVRLLLILLLAIVVLAGFARLLSIAYPVVLLVGGIAIGLLPGVPSPHLAPDLIFVVFLPPLLYSAAFLSSTEDLREQARAIAWLAVGLVLLTIGAVALLAHAVIGLDWTLALLLGAIVAPTDPVAATSVVRRLGAPRRIVTVLEGESLVNDGSALTAYQVLLAALAGGTLALPEIAGDFAATALGGTAIGVAIGWLSGRVRRRLHAPNIEIALALLTAYAAYIAADELGVSGILAAVASGLLVGNRSGDVPPETRLQASAFWETLTFLLNSLLFLLVGLQVERIADGVGATPSATLLGWAAAVSGTVVAVRIAWMFVMPPLVDRLRETLRGELLPHPWQEQLVLGWSGMRGAVSLAAALALPTGEAGLTDPQRSLLIFLTYATIVATLVVPGPTLAPLVRWLGLGQTAVRLREEIEARVALSHAALARLEQIAGGGLPGGGGDADGERIEERTLARVRGTLEERIGRLEERLGEDGAATPPQPSAERRLREALLHAQRAKLGELRGGGRVSLDVLRRVERDLDLEESRLRRR